MWKIAGLSVVMRYRHIAAIIHQTSNCNHDTGYNYTRELQRYNRTTTMPYSRTTTVYTMTGLQLDYTTVLHNCIILQDYTTGL